MKIIWSIRYVELTFNLLCSPKNWWACKIGRESPKIIFLKNAGIVRWSRYLAQLPYACRWFSLLCTHAIRVSDLYFVIYSPWLLLKRKKKNSESVHLGHNFFVYCIAKNDEQCLWAKIIKKKKNVNVRVIYKRPWNTVLGIDYVFSDHP